ncbi:hypothetical protein D0784_17910 [Vibrio campbellii]|nr:hypothetical protein D0784_17910 [Vibrio campbellii]
MYGGAINDIAPGAARDSFIKMQYIKNDWDPQNLFNHAQSIVGTPRPL